VGFGTGNLHLNVSHGIFYIRLWNQVVVVRLLAWAVFWAPEQAAGSLYKRSFSDPLRIRYCFRVCLYIYLVNTCYLEHSFFFKPVEMSWRYISSLSYYTYQESLPSLLLLEILFHWSWTSFTSKVELTSAIKIFGKRSRKVAIIQYCHRRQIYHANY
jgi:hypothetical protein